MILTTLLTGFKLAKSFVSTYKWVMAGIAIAGFATSVFVYIDNHGEMKATIAGMESKINQCISDNGGLDATIAARNATITRMNTAQRELIAANKARIARANAVVEALRTERDVLTEDLGVLRFETIEAIRDDEDFADWVDWTVPVAGWSLLRTAAEAD